MSHSLYLKLPRPIQNLALSGYGANLYRQRFIGGVANEYQGNMTILGEPTETDFYCQKTRLQQLIAHCKEYVPFYQPLLRNVDPTKITNSDLENILPVITKADILANQTAFLSIHPQHKHSLKTANTSGSSGTPLTISYTDEARRINYKIYESALKYLGCSYRSKSTTLAGRILYEAPGRSPDRYDYFNNTQYMSSYFISEESIAHYVDALNRWKPEFIDAYPSAIVELVKLAKACNLPFTFSPKFVLASSENLTIESRSLIETSLNTVVLDHYGCTEMAINAFSSGGSFYSNPRFSVLELQHFYENTYEVITTGLLNFGMPLLRYKIGDLINAPSAGSNYIFESIDGRLDDVIITPEGRKIGRMDPAFKGIQGVALSQLVQTDMNSITAYLVFDKASEHLFNRQLLIDNIQQRTSPLISVTVIAVDSISKGKNGKFKSVVSKIGK